MWTRGKDSTTLEFWKSATRGVARQEGGGVEGMERKLNENHLKLIPGLCREDIKWEQGQWKRRRIALMNSEVVPRMLVGISHNKLDISASWRPLSIMHRYTLWKWLFSRLAYETSYDMVSYRKKEEKKQTKTTWMTGIHGMVGGMGLTEEDWRDRENSNIW